MSNTKKKRRGLRIKTGGGELRELSELPWEATGDGQHQRDVDGRRERQAVGWWKMMQKS